MREPERLRLGRDGDPEKRSGPTFCAWLFLRFFVSSFIRLLDLSSSMMVINGERYSRMSGDSSLSGSCR